MPTTATWFPERQACARTPRPIRHSVAIVQGGVATALVSVALKPFWFSCPRPYDAGARRVTTRSAGRLRAWDRRSKAFGRHGGGIGLTAMAVLHCFHFDFLNYTTGRLDPSYEGIARMTGLARSTVAAAIARLKRLGIINWVRRCAKTYEGGVFTLRQETNAYAVLPPSHWSGYVEPDATPPPWPETWGAVPPLPGLLAQTMTAAGGGAPLARQARILDADPGDTLAASLARLARSLSASHA